MMTMTQKTLQHVMADPAVDTTLTMVAEMVGLTRDTVGKIVASGLPMMANVADANPWVFKAMYAQSVKYVAPPTQAFYTKLGKNATARQALAADFQVMYGQMSETITRAAASQTRTTEEQSGQSGPRGDHAGGGQGPGQGEYQRQRNGIRPAASELERLGILRTRRHRRSPRRVSICVHVARILSYREAAMHRNPIMTTSQARDTIDRLSSETASLRTYGVALQPWIEDFNEALVAFVPRAKMPSFHIGKGQYFGDTALPGAFVQGGLFRQRVESARTDFDTLLIERQQQSPTR